MNPKATFQSVSVEPISWQPQESVFITMCVREKHWRRFGVDTREDRGKWIKNGACSPARPQKREGMIQSPRSPFLKSLGVTWGPSRDASGLVDRFQYSSAVRCPVSTSAEQPAFKVTGGGAEAVQCAHGLGVVTALGGCLLLHEWQGDSAQRGTWKANFEWRVLFHSDGDWCCE